MNIRVDSPGKPTRSFPAARERPLAQISIVPLASNLSAVIFDDPETAMTNSGRFSGLLDGLPVPPPVIQASLDLRRGGRRHAMILGQAAADLSERRILMTLAGQRVAGHEPHWLQPPVVEVPTLTEGLTDKAKARLLKIFLTMGASIFRAEDQSEFGRVALQLLAIAGVEPVELKSWCPVGSRLSLLSYRLDAACNLSALRETLILHDAGIHRLTGFGHCVEQAEQGRILHLMLPARLQGAHAIVGFGERPLVLSVPPQDMAGQPLAPWLRHRDGVTRDWIQDALAAAAKADRMAMDVLREIRHQDDPPVLTVRHLGATGAGVLHSLHLRDPHGQIRSLQMERGGSVVDLPLDRGVDGCGVARGFAPLGEVEGSRDICLIRLLYRSGRLHTAVEAELAVQPPPPPSDEPPTSAWVRGLALSALTRRAQDMPLRVEGFGTELGEAPVLSIVVDLSVDLDLIGARAAHLFRESRWHRAELVYTVGEGEHADAARGALRDTAEVFGMAHRLVVTPAAAAPSERIRAAVGLTRGQAVLLLGAETVPARQGWLDGWIRALGAPEHPAIVGGTLLGADGAIRHAGGEFLQATSDRAERMELRHLGLPVEYLPKSDRAGTALVTAACVGLSREAADLFAADPLTCADPDLILSRHAARLRGEGRPVVMLFNHPFIDYGDPRAVSIGPRVQAAALGLLLAELGKEKRS